MAEEAQPLSVEVVRVKPGDLKLLEENARFMTHEQFARLVANVKRDGALTSLPFVYRDEDGRWLVLSGNHRVQAAIEAGLTEIDVLSTRDTLSPARRKAIQLAHNSITGQDDPALLARIYSSIDSVDERLYAGLDDDTLKLLDKVKPASISELGLEYRTVTFLFLPHQADQARAAFEKAADAMDGDETWLAQRGDFDRLLTSLETVERMAGVRNRAAALHLILEVFERHGEQFLADRNQG